MSGSFKQSINFPSTYEYSSDSENIPLEFYEEAFPISKTIDLLLGYFSTNAIKVLSMSLAEFIYNGGSLRLVTNHFFSNWDYDFITESGNKVDDEIIDIFSDLQELQKNLSPEGKHFFDCLLYLKNQVVTSPTYMTIESTFISILLKPMGPLFCWLTKFSSW